MSANGATPLRLELPPKLQEQIAQRAAELVAAGQAERLCTAEEVAEHLQVDTEWVRRHQAELGAFKLSDGAGRAPIRFRMVDVERFLAGRRLKPPTARRKSLNDPDWAIQ
jgi:hypothetical protein